MNVLPLFESRAKSRSLSESNATNVDVHDHQTGEGERPVPCIERHHSSATYCLDFYAVVGVESGSSLASSGEAPGYPRGLRIRRRGLPSAIRVRGG